MYTVDDLDQVVKLGDIPSMETGAPEPMVLADERCAVLSYLIRQGSPADPLLSEKFAFVRFMNSRHWFGSPNDEALQGHPLWGRGLGYYGAFRVEQSSLVRRLALMNSVHPRHNEAVFEKYRHYIFTFHDSTFECVTKFLEVIAVVECQPEERHTRMRRFLTAERP
jgi:hypothetical protein